MSEMLNKILDDVEESDAQLTEEEVRFTVDDDSKAEWCLDRIREANEEAQRMQEWYTEQMRRILKRRDSRVAFFEEKLKPYFAMVPKKETKTQSSYTLPSGKLILKEQKPEWTHDDAQLLPWVKQNVPSLVKTKESVDWAELKKELTVIWQEDGSQMITNADGEIVPGVTVTERPDKFVVEVK